MKNLKTEIEKVKHGLKTHDDGHPFFDRDMVDYMLGKAISDQDLDGWLEAAELPWSLEARALCRAAAELFLESRLRERREDRNEDGD